MYLNNAYLFGSCFLLVAYPVWLYVFLKKNYYSFQYKAFAAKYGPAYGDIELYDNPSAIWTPILYCLRRFALAAACVCLVGHPLFQWATLLAWQTVAVIYIGYVQPHPTRD
jgi:hypothetical protein